MTKRVDDDATDADLIDAAINGRLEAFEVLVKRYEGVVAATCLSMLGNGPEAEDAGQETMMKFFRSLSKFRAEASVKTYLTRIAMNASLDALRRRQRDRARFEQADDAAMEGAIDFPARANDDIETRQLVRAALDQLKPSHRAVVILRLVHGYTTEEVAQIMKIAHGTVLSRLSRSKAALAATISGEVDHDA